MIHLIKAADRYPYQTDWLSTDWHFSFDHYIVVPKLTGGGRHEDGWGKGS